MMPVSKLMRSFSVLTAFLAVFPGNGQAVQAASDEDPVVEVMTFNIRYGTAEDGENSWRYRREFLFDVIREAAPDIIGTQEALAFQLEELREALPEYAKVGVGRDDGLVSGEFSAILYRIQDFEVLDSGTFWFSATPDVPSIAGYWGAALPRICSWARFADKETGGTFYVYNVHFSSRSQEAREQSAVLLRDRILNRGHPNPVIVTGDFNAGEGTAAMETLLGGGASSSVAGLTDSFRVLYPGAIDVGTFNGFLGTTTGDKIDAVLISSGWDVIAATILRASRSGRYPSDHFPVVATLRLQ
jgi:endonuclease/exonuclease/phosphatase family metal-dependent hydrolase